MLSGVNEEATAVFRFGVVFEGCNVEVVDAIDAGDAVELVVEV